jgi:hypothetical protein
MTELPSFAKASIRFFSTDPFGRKLTIPEFKQLTAQDKHELSQMLNTVPGYEHEPYVEASIR